VKLNIKINDCIQHKMTIVDFYDDIRLAVSVNLRTAGNCMVALKVHDLKMKDQMPRTKLTRIWPV